MMKAVLCTDCGSHVVQISDAIASTPDPNQLKNHTYLMESFENLVAGLEAPFGVSSPAC